MSQAGDQGVDARQLDQASSAQQLVGDQTLPFADTTSWSFRIGLAVVLLSLVSALATYLILTNLTPVTPRGSVVFFVLSTNVLLIGAVIGVICWQSIALYRAWRGKVAGARLHIRIVALFSLIAILPALFLAIAATTTFVRAIDGWFAERTRQIIENSLEVAQAYVEEHGQVIRTDAVNMARDLDDAAVMRTTQPERFRKLVFVQAGLRDLPVAYIINENGDPLITAIENEKLPYRRPPSELIQLAKQGQVPVLEPRNTYRVAAITRLERHPGLYLYVARGVSPKVIRELQRTEAGFEEYSQLRKRRSGLQIAHGLLYFMISLTGMLAAIWAGLWFAGRFVAPIGRLIGAAQHVSRGNLNVVLPEKRGEGDLRRLSQTFNTMTSELKTQRDALVEANEQALERQRFTEAVLSGVSAGVIGLDSSGTITIVNPSAETLLSAKASDLVGEPINQALPQFASLIAQLRRDGGGARKSEALKIEINGDERTFNLHLTQEAAGDDRGAVVTFDDITELETAQRSAAWAVAARYLAHEIKNPLLPIQLSTDRLKRRYGRKIDEDDREIFDKCTDTIARQVQAVEKLVSDFAAFAKIGAPEFQMLDLRKIVQDAATAYEVSMETLKVEMDLPDQPLEMAIDPDQITQVVTNLLKNAAESIDIAAEAGDRGVQYSGVIEVRAARDGDMARVIVIDNGTGLDKQNRKRLFEVGVSSKAKKSRGIGLAVVQQIVEAHGGRIELDDAPVMPERERGAQVTVTLPIRDLGDIRPDAPAEASRPKAAGDLATAD